MFQTKSFAIGLLCLLPCGAEPQEKLPAFPGAEGFGAGTPGGRGGRVVEVTSLEDSGPGTLRDALDAKGPRIVVFRVGGIIELNADLRIREPFVTVAGQTAPGDGICLKNAGITISTHDVVLRYLRVRVGDGGAGPDPGNRDALGAYGNNIMIDHCSFSWALDETVSTWYAAKNVTIQWSIVSEGLLDSLHPQGSHSMGVLLGNGGNSVTFHHNLLAHNSGRNPLIASDKGPSTIDWRNNLIFNHGSSRCGSVRGEISLNYVGNTVLRGPSGREPGTLSVDPEAKQRCFVRDNVWPGGTKEGAEDWKALTSRKPSPERLLSQTPIKVPGVVTQPAKEAYESVLRHAGSVRPLRDVVDARIVEEVRHRTGGIIDSQRDVGGWPVYRSAAPPADGDRDGMPDDWERQHGLSPDDPGDGPKDLDGDGYTNVEEYLNGTDPAAKTAGISGKQSDPEIQGGNEALRYGSARVASQSAVYPPADRTAFLQAVKASGKSAADYVGLKFVRVEAGEFVKGYTTTDIKVTLTRPFEIGATEVTQAQWTAVMGTRPWKNKPFAVDDPDCPATYVSWYDAQEFLERLNASGGGKLRLPTEAEADYAALAGESVDSAEWFKGSMNDKAWHRGNTVRKGIFHAQKVGQKKPNPWGLYDTAGNVLEWCHDHFSYQYWRRGAPKVDPMGPSKPGGRELHVVRGGSFLYSSRVIRAEYDRSSNDPAKSHRAGYRNFDVGFRLVRPMP